MKIFYYLLVFIAICCITIGAIIQLTFSRKSIKLKHLHKIEIRKKHKQAQ